MLATAERPAAGKSRQRRHFFAGHRRDVTHTGEAALRITTTERFPGPDHPTLTPKASRSGPDPPHTVTVTARFRPIRSPFCPGWYIKYLPNLANVASSSDDANTQPTSHRDPQRR